MTEKTAPEILAKYTGDEVAGNCIYRPWDIDYIHSARKVRCVSETAAYLYSSFTPTTVSYVSGSRPELEWHVSVALKDAKTQAEKAVALTRHVNRVVLHTMHIPQELRELGGTEEHILRRGFGYCNEMARVLTILAQIAGIPSRLVFVRQPCGDRHVICELHIDGSWGFFDPSFNFSAQVEGRFASALEVREIKTARSAVDLIAKDNPKCIYVLGPAGKNYGDYFETLFMNNYGLADFAYGVVRPG